MRDRLRVLLPSDANNTYTLHDIIPREMRDDLNRARIVITNFHAFKDVVGRGHLNRIADDQEIMLAFLLVPEHWSAVTPVQNEFCKIAAFDGVPIQTV